MIDSFYSENFKGIGGFKFEFKRLNLLTGVNGVGKSSVTQAILLAKLAAIVGKEKMVPLNGPFNLALGEAADVLDQAAIESPRNELLLKLSLNRLEHCWKLKFDDVSARSLHVHASPAKVDKNWLDTRTGYFGYLAAGRDGPKEFQPLQTASKEYKTLGAFGQYSAELLSVHELDSVTPEIEHPSAGGLRLAKQVEAWLAEFVLSVQVRSEIFKDVGVATLRFKGASATAEWVKPNNMGFGVTHSLPIIIASLLAKKKSILIIDTPEAHLHPAAQSAMGRFLARVAASGVQVIVETHSDHFLNGVRLAVADNGHPIAAADVAIYHLSHSADGFRPTQIHLSESGNLSSRPQNFFDQSEKDLAAIVRKRLTK